MMCVVIMILAGCSKNKNLDSDPAPVPDYTPFLTEQPGELRVVVLVNEKLQEETRAVNDMVAAMAGRFTPIIYDVRTEEGEKAEEQLGAIRGEYPVYYLFDNQQLLSQGPDLSQIAQAAMDYTDRLSIGGTGG
jgi:hypothetical protein